MFNDAYISPEWKDIWKEWNVDIWWVVWLGYRKELGIKEMPQGMEQVIKQMAKGMERRRNVLVKE